MKMNPKNSKDEYRQQAQRGAFDVPPSGTAIVVNTKIQRQKIGKAGTARVQIWTRILEIVVVDEKEHEEDAREWVGKELQQSLWWNLEKPGNVSRANCMAIACDHMDAWDSDVDADLVKAMTGVPYLLKWRRKEEEFQGQKRFNIDVYATEQISSAKRKEFTGAPDWLKIAGAPDARLQPFKDFTGGKESTSAAKSKSNASGETDVDPFGDAPFSDGSG